jgi:hypothetical protein
LLQKLLGESGAVQAVTWLDDYHIESVGHV